MENVILGQMECLNCGNIIPTNGLPCPYCGYNHQTGKVEQKIDLSKYIEKVEDFQFESINEIKKFNI